MLKFEGKNRSFKISSLIGKEETLEKNDKYLTIPIIITNDFLRIYDLYNNKVENKEENKIEIFKKDASADLPYEIFFENSLKEYMEKVIIHHFDCLIKLTKGAQLRK